MVYEMVQDAEVEFNELLRMEQGWSDVAKGLTQVLFGYSILILGTVAGLGLVILAMTNAFSSDLGKSSSRPSAAVLWELYAGLGILSVIGLISFSIIVGGQFKCLLHAAERHGARWFMFMCIACLFLSPAFQMASGIASWQTISELKQNPSRLRDVQLNPLGHWLQLIGFALSMLYPLFFTLFLRAIAVCLRLQTQQRIVEAFLAFAAALVAATGLMVYQYPRVAAPLPLPLAQALVLGAGWFVLGVIYLGLICMMRISILFVVARMKSPLEM